MARTVDRGTKRTCQNSSCGARFYDLARDPIVCPMCGAVYQLAVAPAAAAASGPVEAAVQRRPAKKPEFAEAVAPDEVPEAEGEDVLVDVEGAVEPIAAGEEETFLEEEDEGGDVSGIISSGQEGDEEV
jgi:uncharacterized protein (TIGR02300 family)